jgi:hypothetical protein
MYPLIQRNIDEQRVFVPPDATTLTRAPTSTPSPGPSTTLSGSTTTLSGSITTSGVQSDMPSDSSSIAGPVSGGVVGGVVVGVLVGALLVLFWRRGQTGRTYPAKQNERVKYPQAQSQFKQSGSCEHESLRRVLRCGVVFTSSRPEKWWVTSCIRLFD